MSQSKTPQFDALLDTILARLVPHSRACADCAKDFDITADDIGFYKMLRVPTPTHCPDCRHRRRLSFSNYSTIYKRACNAPGHSEMMISPVAPILPWITYDYDTYYSDAWDPMSYGMDMEASQAFFSQFLGLVKEVPQPGVRRGADSPNSDYSFYGKRMKDCYYVFGGRRSEDVLFGSSIYDSKHIMDSYFIRQVDIGFNNVITTDCYKCFYAYFSSSCIDCTFVHDCRNCQDCFGCVNLRNKRYCWFNEQLTKEEYQKRKAAADIGDRKVFEKYRDEFWKFVRANPIAAVRVSQSQNVSGNDIKHSQNCQHCFQIADSENLRYASFAIMMMKDSMDIGFGGKAERLYETQNVGTNSANVKFSFAVKESTDCEFLLSSSNCSNCFGCIGLKNASYCIFNKQYTEDEYFKKVDAIKSEMLARGEYGEFLPMALAPCSYDGSMAQIMFPMAADEARRRSLYWQEDIGTDTSNIQTIQADDLPINSKDVGDDICRIAIIGKDSSKPFRIVPRELAFYKRYGLPLPTHAPYQRIIDRFKITNNFRVDTEVCFKCGKNILSAYKTSDGYQPYCESCYQEEVI